jgi:hypothetical protein
MKRDIAPIAALALDLVFEAAMRWLDETLSI